VGAAAVGVAATTNFVILAATAKAQGNGNGGGNGNGNGGGNGGGNGNSGGNGGGNGANGNGGGNGAGNGGDNGNGNGKNGQGKGKGSASSSSVGSSADAKPASPANHARVVHATGMSESVNGGRYEMHDAKGRLIVRRRATLGDVSRLRSAR